MISQERVDSLFGEKNNRPLDEIKSRLHKPPVLHLPDRKGRFQLYSDTSKIATGSVLYQSQNGKPKLIAYASKRLPETAKNYSITKLKMCGLAINITSFAHVLKKVDFDAVVDHLALTHIMRSKVEPPTMRIERLPEVLSSYSFNLHYIKVKDMILSDFLSRQRVDNSDPHEIISISFNMRDVLQERYYNLNSIGANGKYLVQSRPQAKSSGVSLPEVHGIGKSLDPHIRPEKQKPISSSTDMRPPVYKLRIGQGRAGVRRRVKMIMPSQPKQTLTPATVEKSIPEVAKQPQVTAQI